jgi:hypothetical protein
MLVVINFTSYRYCQLTDMGQMTLEGITTGDKREKPQTPSSKPSMGLLSVAPV